MRSNMIWTTRSLQMKMTLSFCVALPHESFINTRAHAWTHARRAKQPLFCPSNIIATSFQRSMTIVRSFPFRLAKMSSLSRRRTERATALCVPQCWWLNKIHMLRADLVKQDGAPALLSSRSHGLSRKPWASSITEANFAKEALGWQKKKEKCRLQILKSE